jgi:hypothetical protein
MKILMLKRKILSLSRRLSMEILINFVLLAKTPEHEFVLLGVHERIHRLEC